MVGIYMCIIVEGCLEMADFTTLRAHYYTASHIGIELLRSQIQTTKLNLLRAHLMFRPFDKRLASRAGILHMWAPAHHVGGFLLASLYGPPLD